MHGSDCLPRPSFSKNLGLLQYVLHKDSKFSVRQVLANSAYPEEQSDQGLKCLQAILHLLEAYDDGQESPMLHTKFVEIGQPVP